MNQLKKIIKQSTSNLKSIYPPVLLVVATIFLFGPITIYSGNIGEFEVGLPNILVSYIIPSILMSGILIGIGIFLSEKYLSRYVSLLTIIGVLLWIQGNILVWSVGVFGKGELQIPINSWMGWIDSAVWGILLLLPVLFHKKVFKIRIFLIVLLFTLQLGNVVFMSFQKPETWKTDFSATNTPTKEMFEYSKGQNVIHFLLDELQSSIFHEIIDSDPEYYYPALEGFTFFQEATGSFPTTVMSLPATISGINYTNHIPIDTFRKSIYTGETISNTLYENGYGVDIAAAALTQWFRKSNYSNLFSIRVPYGGTGKQLNQRNAMLILRIALFRHVPFFLKKAVYSIKYSPIPHTKDKVHFTAARNFACTAFLQDLIDNISVTRDKPVYKFVHITTPHYPATMNNNCEYSGKILKWNWPNIKVQAKCAFDHFVEFLKALKASGVYDSSLIIIQADHGYWKVDGSAETIGIKNQQKVLAGYINNNKEYFAQIVSSALPLLTVKLPHSKGPLKISSAPVALTDIPATIYTHLNLPVKMNGRSVFDVGENENRERKFHYYETLNFKGDDYFFRLDEFAINGNPYDKASWTFLSHLVPASASQVSKIVVGTREAAQSLRSGWGAIEKTKSGRMHRWALGNSASVLLSLPKDKTVILTAKVRSLFFRTPQTITIKVDGKKVGFWKLSPASWKSKLPWSWDTHSVKLSPDQQRPDTSVVEFIFSQFLETKKGDKRPLAVLFDSIALTRAPQD